MSVDNRLAGSTAQHEAAERRLAARTLLACPVLTSQRQPDELAVVRRHSAALRSAFAKLLGYHLIVETSFARLVKTPPSPDSPLRPVQRGDSPPFTPQTYALFSLACAALLTPGTGEWLLISSLVEQVRADTASAGIELRDTPSENRRLVQAVGLLIDWGVLTETDGSLSAWSERREEGVLQIHRPLLPHVLPRPLRNVTSLADLTAQLPSGASEPRRSLRRRLVENPLVKREELPEDERDVLSRERSELTRLLEEHFGLTLEVRAEGALAYDTEGTLSDVAYPGPGTVRQAALLLTDALTDLARPAAGHHVPGAAADVPGLLTPWDTVRSELDGLASRYARAWAGAYIADPARLQKEVVALLESMSLARSLPEGLVLHPAAARYRPEPQAQPTRAARRLADTPPDAASAPPSDVLFTESFLREAL
ncbi:TIGR02678 family protein [Streptomyces phaeochromogenes]|uniref:TIGR02678 family protein n=1 Tax=Streptomyces phaeochromogenes TaxID=1923 RepID=UPI002DDA6E98|nr:TIGR02678 family protein [Streptomyces phaeochromogenes]WRZ26256.1 TIGR02678 family protein [Streptomyces phaeochromogenes]